MLYICGVVKRNIYKCRDAASLQVFAGNAAHFRVNKHPERAGRGVDEKTEVVTICDHFLELGLSTD
jgi:hypothetical protein